MTVWIKGDIHLTKAFEFNKPDKNVVILGKLDSTHDITFKVNNLVVFGALTSSTGISIKTEKDFFNSGNVSAENLKISGKVCYNGLDAAAVECIRALGIDVLMTETGSLRVNVPS